ncbi:MAG: hypothetical protein OMM_03127 [Candidatus Magnetoglobus multicellularis str. Araruama]|uniref:Carbohydrate kinase PfkB domain-containing protein n=1 Tax=Candidatus Magnetoglobus multicellularis str. Araruama TaxID=890399 RepID=A0A1V1P6T7_9BACT|nr:MAG: hypothetical protein OMM_03127 [Candidatus Magnetoglobus multicellularis str. Araruama]
MIIGSGLAENILSIDTTIEYQNKYIELNKKYIAKRRELFLGGSGINFSIRLAKTNHLILPILSMGKDEFGFKTKKILSNILINNIKNNSIINFIESEDFLCDQLVSSNTTVISSNNTRTTFTPELKGIEHFSNFVDNRLDRVSKLNNIKIKAIMIGHIYADDPKYQNEGIITKRIIQKFKEKSFIFANFGESQLNSGLTFWKNHLKDVSVIQFSLPEVKQFFFRKGKKCISFKNN